MARQRNMLVMYERMMQAAQKFEENEQKYKELKEFHTQRFLEEGCLTLFDAEYRASDVPTVKSAGKDAIWCREKAEMYASVIQAAHVIKTNYSDAAKRARGVTLGNEEEERTFTYGYPQAARTRAAGR